MESDDQKTFNEIRFAISKIYTKSISNPKTHHILNYHSTWIPLDVVKEKLLDEIQNLKSENINEILLEIERMGKIRLRSAECESIGIWSEEKRQFEHLNQCEVRNRAIQKLELGIPTSNRGILYYLQVWHSMSAD